MRYVNMSWTRSKVCIYYLRLTLEDRAYTAPVVGEGVVHSCACGWQEKEKGMDTDKGRVSNITHSIIRVSTSVHNMLNGPC